MHVQNKKYGNFVSISSLTGKCAAQKLKKICSSSLWTCLHHMVILSSPNKITDFLMILAWLSSFNCFFFGNPQPLGKKKHLFFCNAKPKSNVHAHLKLADEVAGHSPADQLPIEKTCEAPVWCLAALIWLSSGVQSICVPKKCMPATFNKFLWSRWENINNGKFESSWYEQYKRRLFCLNFWSL